MNTILNWADAWLIALVFAVAMLAAWVAGWRLGQRLPPESGDDPGTKFTDASMALLGLLLAFTFSMALGHHDQRRLAVVAESNAIDDFYTCATLLKEPHRSQLQKVIHEYALNQVLTPYKDPSSDDGSTLTQQSLKSVTEMTDIVAQATTEGTPIAVSLTNTLNNVTSSNASRVAAYRETLPWSIVTLLFISSLVPSFLIGEKQGTTNKVHYSGTLCFIALVTLVIFVTLDLNQPARGLIRVRHYSLEKVIESMGK